MYNKKEYNKRYYKKSQGYKKREWTAREEDIITTRNDLTDNEISKIIGRSVQSIQVKRSRLKKNTLF